ncbi:MAG: hypothetical protein IJK63_00040 [Oscillospiraceae bacterium]|nr:hypothetical protein [Clostridia bacterium]MBQ6272593.1 hypothetical protein [Oscillospiraceae bacterium]
MAEWIGHLTLIGDDFDLPQVTEALSCEPSWLRRKEEVLESAGSSGIASGEWKRI